MTRPGGLAWFGATLVWCGAATLSFSGLNGLAVSCYISERLGWLLPLVIDVGVAVAAWVWRRGVNPEASRLAGRLTWSLLTLTIIGNGAHLGMESAHITPPWFVAAVVGAIPAAVAGTVAHLLVLLGRSVDSESTHGNLASPGPSLKETGSTLHPPRVKAAVVPRPKQDRLTPTPDKTSAERARALLAAEPGIGRRALAARAGVSEYVARTVLAEQVPRNGHRVLEATK